MYQDLSSDQLQTLLLVSIQSWRLSEKNLKLCSEGAAVLGASAVEVLGPSGAAHLDAVVGGDVLHLDHDGGADVVDAAVLLGVEVRGEAIGGVVQKGAAIQHVLARLVLQPSQLQQVPVSLRLQHTSTPVTRAYATS